jgi:hypothetical protein
MPHPALGLPPADVTAGHPGVAARLRAAADRLPALSLRAALRRDPGLAERHDELMLRRLLRDYDRHIEQLALAVATGQDGFVTAYAEMRRRRVRMNDVVTLIEGLEEAALAIGPAADAEAIHAPVAAWIERLRHHRRLPGDHDGNAVARFLYKGAGLGDDTVV